MIPQYTFKLNNGVTDVKRNVYPVWKEDLTLDWAYESNQMFRRSSLSGNLTFVGDDYDYIVGTPFENTFTLEIYVSYDNGGYSTLYWSGVFHWTDCTVNVDDRSVKVKPETRDRYSKILAGMDKEYDLIKLNPAAQPVTVTRRPMIQVYVPGQSVMNCFLQGMQWEQDCSSVTSNHDLTEDYHFGKVGDFVELTFTGTVPQYLTETFIGTWPNTLASGEWRTFQNSQNVYFITCFQDGLLEKGMRIYSESNPTTVLWEWKQIVYSPGESSWNDIPSPITFTSKRSGVADLTAEWLSTPTYARWLLAVDRFGNNDAYDIPEDDIVTNNRNYRYCYPFGYDGLIKMSYNHSNYPTEWGIRPDGEYYVQPDASLDVIKYLPVSRSMWGYASLWFCETEATIQLEVSGRKETLLRDAFTLEAVINALLGEIDPTILFDGTQIYSRFLYGTNPLLLSGVWGRLVMTPKSNILVAEYTQPARKAPITLGQVLEMLKKACGCYWFINDANQLIIEHVSWFKNGGSYSGTQAIGIDITSATNTRNGKALSFGTNEYHFDKTDMAERYQYEWMDDTTDIFKGEAIEVLSSFVNEGKIEEVNIAGFNPDLDYMMLNPSGVSEDGFALMNCTVTNNDYVVPIGNMSGLTPDTYQNWVMIMPSLQQAFLISDMPSWNIKVNGQATVAKGIQRKKKQTVPIPLGYIDPNIQLLVETGVGVGEITKMNINLSSRTAKTEIAYDTTQQ